MASAPTIGGTLSCAIGVTMCVIQVQHPDWLGNHSWVLPVCAIWIAVSFLAVLAQLKWFQRLLGTASVEDGIASISSNVTASPVITVSPSIVGSSQSVNQTFYGVTPTLSATSTMLNEEKEENLLPQLVMIPAIPTPRYQGQRGCWEFAPSYAEEDAQETCVVWVANTPGTLGKTVTKTPKLVAHLEFIETQFHTPLGYISRAYWMDRSANSLAIASGERHAVVLGFMREDKWVCSTNPWEHPLTGSFRALTQYDLNRPLQGEQTFDFVHSLGVKVSLITEQGTTVSCKNYLLNRTDQTFSILEVTDDTQMQ